MGNFYRHEKFIHARKLFAHVERTRFSSSIPSLRGLLRHKDHATPPIGYTITSWLHLRDDTGTIANLRVAGQTDEPKRDSGTRNVGDRFHENLSLSCSYTAQGWIGPPAISSANRKKYLGEGVEWFR
jgi:hypothetical protein